MTEQLSFPFMTQRPRCTITRLPQWYGVWGQWERPHDRKRAITIRSALLC
jgi:hypothetical protein